MELSQKGHYKNKRRKKTKAKTKKSKFENGTKMELKKLKK
jgi:hypothetical protein